jgi:hypothetical protein
MRKLVVIGALLALALGLAGCSGGGSSPTEPAGTTNRGNWIGTITGKSDTLHLDGTCTLEMNLDPAFNGQWWVDCPGGSSQGEVLSVLTSGVAVMVLTTRTPPSTCPWAATATATVSTLDGDFQVVDCPTHAVVGSGTLQLRRR